MNWTWRWLAAGLAVAVLAAGCGGRKPKAARGGASGGESAPAAEVAEPAATSDEGGGAAAPAAAAQQGAAEMAAGLAAMQQAFAGAAAKTADGKPVVLADFHELKKLLPETIGAFKRTSHTGEKNGAMGMTVASAEAEYEAEGGGRLKIKIQDLGGIGGFGAMAAAGWMMADIDKETDTGYERTTTIAGNKALEKYDRSDRRGEVQLMIAKRFMVEVNAYDADEDVLQGAVKAVDLAQLPSLVK